MSAITSVRVTLYDCECQRCSYQWRTEDPPKRCPSCRSPYWRVPAGVLPRGQPPKRKRST